MRLYKGDTVCTMTMDSNAGSAVQCTTREVLRSEPDLAIKSACIEYGTHVVRGPVPLDPMGVASMLPCRVVVIEKLTKRPWYNHLRAALDSILQRDGDKSY